MKNKHCKYTILIESPDWRKCPDKCEHYGKHYCSIKLQEINEKQENLFKKGGEKDE